MTELIGAHVAGYSALVVDTLFKRHLKPYLGQMSPEQRRELESTRRAVHAAVAYWLNQRIPPGADDGATAAVLAAIGEGSDRGGELTTSDAAGLLGLRERRVRELA